MLGLAIGIIVEGSHTFRVYSVEIVEIRSLK
jgi:hypothetical protein